MCTTAHHELYVVYLLCYLPVQESVDIVNEQRVLGVVV